MKTLFIYYSHTGNGELVSQALQEKGVAIRKVIRKKKLPKSFFWMIMSGGFLAGIKHKDKLVNFDKNIDEYDNIIVGSPIWNGRFSSPINTVLHQLDLSSKTISFVLYSGSGEANHALKRINKEYPSSKVIILKEPKKYPEQLKKLDELILDPAI